MTETIFFNVWQTDSRERQAAFLAELRSEATVLAAKPGFLGLTVWGGLDGNQRVHRGDIGKAVLGQVFYYTGRAIPDRSQSSSRTST